MKDLDEVLFFSRKSELWASAVHCLMYVFTYSWVCVLFSYYYFLNIHDFMGWVLLAPFVLPIVATRGLFDVLEANNSSSVRSVKQYTLAVSRLIGLVCLCLGVMAYSGFVDGFVFILIVMLFMAWSVSKMFLYVGCLIESLCQSPKLSLIVSETGVIESNGQAEIGLWGEKISGLMLVLEKYRSSGVSEATNQFVFGWKISSIKKLGYCEHSPIQSVFDVVYIANSAE